MVVGKAGLLQTHSEVPKDVTAQWLATVPQINTICTRPLNLSSNGLSSESRFVLFFVSQVILVFASSREQPELRTSSVCRTIIGLAKHLTQHFNV